jgi:hemoglobin
MSENTGEADSLYSRVGGEDFFYQLVSYFYEGVENDHVLRPLYPQDLSASISHLALFLAQYWGGPPTYGELRGHPRLRMRHAPFVIGAQERDAWLAHMRIALDKMEVAPSDKEALTEYLVMAAHQLVNAIG